eukprot:jgi/Chrzof1/13557/Cz08g02020.t1
MKQCGVAPATAAPPTACPVKHVTTAEAAAVGKENAAAAASSYIPPAAADTSSSMQACSTSTATTIAPNRNSGSSSNSSAMPSALPTLHYRGTVRYAATAIEVDWVCGELLAAAPLVVGLDVEWKPNYVKGQAPGRAALIQELLLSDGIIKVGVNIGGDASKLACDYGVHMAATADLSDFAKDRSRVLGELEDVTANVEYRRWSLAALSAELLQAALPKPPRIRLGNWERRPLDPDQQAYAACDAYASLALHWALAALQARVTVSQVAVAADSKEDVVEQ